MDIHLTIEFLGKGKNEYTLNDAKTAIKEWRGSDAQPTSSELTKGWTDYQAAQAAVKYKTDRTTNGSPVYADFGEQLDMLYKDLVAGKLDASGTWAAHIAAVKGGNPKP